MKTLSPNVIAAMVGLLSPSNVARVYSGRPGCGCGCKGAYRSAGPMVTRNISALQADPSKVQYGKGMDDTMCFSLENDTRYRWVYVKRSVVAAMLKQVRTAKIR